MSEQIVDRSESQLEEHVNGSSTRVELVDEERRPEPGETETLVDAFEFESLADTADRQMEIAKDAEAKAMDAALAREDKLLAELQTTREWIVAHGGKVGVMHDGRSGVYVEPRKVEIVVSGSQDPSRIAKTVAEAVQTTRQTPKAKARGAKAAAKPARAAKPGRLARRTTAQLEASLKRIVAFVKGRDEEGAKAEEIKKALGLDVREMPKLLKMGLESKQLKAKGEKRARTYFVK